MKLPPDFKEFLELFNAKGVEYMIEVWTGDGTLPLLIEEA